VRFLIEALLTLWFGPQIVTLTGSLFAHHFLWILVGVGALVVAWLIWRRAKRKRGLNRQETADSSLRSE
jgi:glucose dehydrogenase